LWFALRHGSRPPWLLPAAAALGFYALEPLNFTIPLFGIVDDFIVLPLLLRCLVKAIPRDIQNEFSGRRFAN
jgi:uncharacterized membrane protein YkvA (DUF1232 family)